MGLIWDGPVKWAEWAVGPLDSRAHRLRDVLDGVAEKP